ncbi:hypothetical protein [Clostridium kluyveri]|uniref:hypothetical protein n=1 Tax=Clostridium kluyveri TaxID=1534 RepID=UPI001FA8B974|nr:hypothetical protein [Clostridium kluyveri]
MSKLKIIRGAKPIKFGNQIGMKMDELDRGTIPGIPQKERSEGRETKSKEAEIQE